MHSHDIMVLPSLSSQQFSVVRLFRVRLVGHQSYLDSKKIECGDGSGGALPCYGGLSWLKFSTILGGAPVYYRFKSQNL